jgi:F-type H+-transporting ATPase subunit delta
MSHASPPRRSPARARRHAGRLHAGAPIERDGHMADHMADQLADGASAKGGSASGGSIVSGVAGRYATALFELARDSGEVDAVASDLARFSAMIAESADLQRFLRSPVFTAEEQAKTIVALLAKAGIGGLAANFLRVVASKRRLFAVEGMIAAYRALVAQSKGIVTAQVTVAEPVSEARLAEIRKALEEVSGRTVEVDLKVDPALIGGLIVKLGSRMVDASLRTKLNSIRLAMKEVG